MRLSEVPVGATVVVAHVNDGDRARRLEDLGFLPGTRIRVERRAPLRDPSVYQLRGVRLAVRRADADLVEILEILEPAEVPDAPR